MNPDHEYGGSSRICLASARAVEKSPLPSTSTLFFHEQMRGAYSGATPVHHSRSWSRVALLRDPVKRFCESRTRRRSASARAADESEHLVNGEGSIESVHAHPIQGLVFREFDQAHPAICDQYSGEGPVDEG